MALRWLEGFEGLTLGVLLARKYEAGSVAGNLVATLGWQDKGTALQSQGTSTGFDVTTPELVAVDEDSWIIGWAWRLDDTSGLSNSQTTFPGVILQNAAGDQLQFEMVADNHDKPGGIYWRLQVRRGSTVLGTSDASFNYGVWYYIEVKATIDPINGSYEMRWWTRTSTAPVVDAGASNAGPVNTANQAAAGADRVRVLLLSAPLTGGTDNISMDDLYVCDDTGATSNDYLGRQVIEVMHPSGNGNSLEWDLTGGAASLVDAWEESANLQSSTEDDKRTTSDVTDQKELATYTSLSNIRLVSVTGILLHTQHRMDTSGQRNIAPLLRKTTGTPAEVMGTEVTLDNTAFDGSSEVFEQDPNTSSPWVIADLNSYQFGVQNRV